VIVLETNSIYLFDLVLFFGWEGKQQEFFSSAKLQEKRIEPAKKKLFFCSFYLNKFAANKKKLN
jgi:hypothetical protein